MSLLTEQPSIKYSEGMGRTAYTEDEAEGMRSRMIWDAIVLHHGQGIAGLTPRAMAIRTGVITALPYRYFKHIPACQSSHDCRIAATVPGGSCLSA